MSARQTRSSGGAGGARQSRKRAASAGSPTAASGKRAASAGAADLTALRQLAARAKAAAKWQPGPKRTQERAEIGRGMRHVMEAGASDWSLEVALSAFGVLDKRYDDGGGPPYAPGPRGGLAATPCLIPSSENFSWFLDVSETLLQRYSGSAALAVLAMDVFRQASLGGVEDKLARWLDLAGCAVAAHSDDPELRRAVLGCLVVFVEYDAEFWDAAGGVLPMLERFVTPALPHCSAAQESPCSLQIMEHIARVGGWCLGVESHMEEHDTFASRNAILEAVTRALEAPLAGDHRWMEGDRSNADALNFFVDGLHCVPAMQAVFTGALDVVAGWNVDYALPGELWEYPEEDHAALLTHIHSLGGSQPGARRAATALLYSGDLSLACEFKAGGKGLEQIELAIASDDWAARAHGATAVSYIMTGTSMLKLRPPPKAFGSGGIDGGAAAASPAGAETLHSFASWFGSEKHSDVTFEVGGRRLPAHAIVLSASESTDVFDAMLDHGTADAITRVVPVADVRFEVFQHVLRFLYTGEAGGAAIPDADLPDVFRAARRWMVVRLQHAVVARLVGALSVARWQGVWEVLALVAEDADGEAQLPQEMQAHAARFLLDNVREAVRQPTFVAQREQLAQLLVRETLPKVAEVVQSYEDEDE